MTVNIRKVTQSYVKDQEGRLAMSVPAVAMKALYDRNGRDLASLEGSSPEEIGAVVHELTDARLEALEGAGFATETVVDSKVSEGVSLAVSTAQGMFQPKGSYVTTDTLTGYYTSARTDELLSETEDYLTGVLQPKGDYALRSEIASVYRARGSVATVADLPTDAQVGDVYDVRSDGMNRVWTGTAWDELGASMEGYATIASVELLQGAVDGVSDAVTSLDGRVSDISEDVAYLKEHSVEHSEFDELSAVVADKADTSVTDDILESLNEKANETDVQSLYNRVEVVENSLASYQRRFEVVSVPVPLGAWTESADGYWTASVHMDALSVVTDDDLVFIDATDGDSRVVAMECVAYPLSLESGTLSMRADSQPSAEMSFDVTVFPR